MAVTRCLERVFYADIYYGRMLGERNVDHACPAPQLAKVGLGCLNE